MLRTFLYEKVKMLVTFLYEKVKMLVKFLYEKVLNSQFRCEIYALLSLAIGITFSIVCGVKNNDWYIFPSTISTLNSQFSEPSGRIFFGTLILAGILLIKSNNTETNEILDSINTLGYICILGIALFPTAQINDFENFNKRVMLSFHLIFAAVLFFLVPCHKLYRIIIGKKQPSLRKIHILKFIVLAICLFFFCGFIICQIYIFKNKTEDRLRVPNLKPLEGKDYWIKSHVISFVLELLCVIFIFIELVIHVYQEHCSKKNTTQQTQKDKNNTTQQTQKDQVTEKEILNNKKEDNLTQI